MAALYFSSAALGVGAALWFGFSATAASTVYGILVAAVLAGIGLAILYFKNNELQDWCKKSAFGVNADKFINEAKELQTFNEAFGEVIGI